MTRTVQGRMPGWLALSSEAWRPDGLRPAMVLAKRARGRIADSSQGSRP